MSRRIRAVLFDMGGVLVPEVSSFELAAREPDLLESLRQMGIADPEPFVRDCAAQVRGAYRALNEACTQPDLDEVLGQVNPAVRKLLFRAFAARTNRTPYPTALPLLRRLSSRYRLGLVSNNIIPGDHHLRCLTRAGLMRHLGCAVWSANFGRRKPDPSMIHWVLKRLEVPAREALFIGDKIRTDVRAARRAGVLSVHLRRQGMAETEACQPDFVIRGLGELPLLLQQLG